MSKNTKRSLTLTQATISPCSRTAVHAALASRLPITTPNCTAVPTTPGKASTTSGMVAAIQPSRSRILAIDGTGRRIRSRQSRSDPSASRQSSGSQSSCRRRNHHNFAWKESFEDVDGSTRELIVHRKGATPAGENVLGIIPGSMADAGYVVRGKGKPTSLNSASHGAGRLMSRRAANESITKTERDRYIRKQGVTLFGGDLDEAPQAYKNIDDVIEAQSDLIEVVGKFTPKIVRMDGKSNKHRGRREKKRGKKRR